MKSLLYIGNRLSAHGSTVTAIEVLGPLLEREGFRLRYASSRKNKLLRFADMLRATITDARRVDFVLIDTYSTWNFWYAFAVSQVCRMLRAKYIPILHGGNLPVRLRKNPILCRMVFGNAYINVAPSGYLLHMFRDAGYKTALVPNPFDSAEFPFTQRKNIGPKLLWVRAFSPIYNPEMAVRTFAEIIREFPDATLCMVGPEKTGLLEKMKRISESQRLGIRFTGRLSKPEWAALSTEYDIFLNTARIDNTPFSIIEAASLGMAVVSTDVGGIPHLLENGKTALLVRDNDDEAMAEAIRKIVMNQDFAQQLIVRSQRLTRQSDWSELREKWLEIFK